MTLRLPVTSWPPMRASPEMTARSSGSRRRMAIAVVDLPEPDSPMIVTVSPWSMWKLTPSTARTTLVPVSSSTCRSVTSRTLMSGLPSRVAPGRVGRLR